MKLGLLGLLLLVGCSSAGAAPDGGTPDASPDTGGARDAASDAVTDAPPPPPGETLFVATDDGASVSSWPVGATGNVSPSLVLEGPSTRLAAGKTLAIAVDDSARLYVLQSDLVLVFAAGASGDSAPVRTFTRTNVGRFASIAVAPGGTPYILHESNLAVTEIGVYSSAASGVVDPLRTIEGPSTSLTAAMSIALSGDAVFVADMTLLEFSANASGDAPPLSSRPYANGSPAFVAAGAGKDAFITQPTIYSEYPEGQAGSTHTVGGPTSAISSASGIAVDAAGEVFVANQAPTSSVLVFPAASDGDVAPVRTLSGSLTRISASMGNPLPIAIH